MSENFYQYCKGKASLYARSPKLSCEALQLYLGNLSVMLQRFTKTAIYRTVRKSAQESGTNFVEHGPGVRILKSGCWCVKNSSWAGPLRSLQDGLKSNIQRFLQAMKQFISGSTIMSAVGSASWFALTADDSREGILAGTKNFMSPREHRSKKGLHRCLQGDDLATGRRTP